MVKAGALWGTQSFYRDLGQDRGGGSLSTWPPTGSSLDTSACSDSVYPDSALPLPSARWRAGKAKVIMKPSP